MRLDELVHHEVRLQVFAYLYRYGESTFDELTAALDASTSTLDEEVRRMAAADAVRITETEGDALPRTEVALTATGEERFEAHVERLGEYANRL